MWYKPNLKIPASFEDMVKKSSFKNIKTNFSKSGYFLETINWINPKSLKKTFMRFIYLL